MCIKELTPCIHQLLWLTSCVLVFTLSHANPSLIPLYIYFAESDKISKNDKKNWSVTWGRRRVIACSCFRALIKMHSISQWYVLDSVTIYQSSLGEELSVKTGNYILRLLLDSKNGYNWSIYFLTANQRKQGQPAKTETQSFSHKGLVLLGSVFKLLVQGHSSDLPNALDSL